MKFGKILSLLMAAVLILTACGGAKKPAGVELKSDITGTVFYIEQEYLDMGLDLEPVSEDPDGHKTISVSWYYTPEVNRILDEANAMDPDDLTEEYIESVYAELDKHAKIMLDVTLVEEEEYDARTKAGEKAGDISYCSTAEEFGKNSGYVYLVAIPENNTDGMSAEEKEIFEKCAAYIPTIKSNLKLIEKSAEAVLPEKFPSFSAKDLAGNTVTDSIFHEKDLTIVNIWGTFCGPCINEMPELGEWARELPDNVQLIGLVCDIEGDADTEHHDLAVEITEKANANFPHVVANSDFNEIMNWVTGVPTTLFVDKDGNIVGEPVIGARVQAYKDFTEAYING